MQAAVIGHWGRDVSCFRVERSLSHSVTQSIERDLADLKPSVFYTSFTISPSPRIN